MASYDHAWKLTGGFEGGYVNNPHDAGGETYAGIARRWNPDWMGWAFIDKIPPLERNDSKIGAIPEIHDMVQSLYKAKYWDVHGLDACGDDEMASAIFDTSVLFSPVKAGKWAQMALNFLNEGDTRWPDLMEDGCIGRGTLSCLDLARTFRREWGMVFISLRMAAHIEETRKRVQNEVFATGWTRRCEQLLQRLT